MKSKKWRCPLQAECERKCTHEGHELDCDYYRYNARDELVIEDQEAIRRQREREREDRLYEELLAADDGDDPEEDSEYAAEAPAEEHIAATGKLVILPIGMLHPHPDNPRKELGDLTELADSIRAKGVFQNLTVVPHEDGYRIIIGHRRRAASELAGLTHLPCVIVDMTTKEQVETMLLENMQREDLTPYEQAQGFQMMIDMGDTPEEIAEKTGFSKKTVKRRLKMAELDPTILKEVSCRQISLDDFDQLAKIEDIEKRNTVLKSIGTNNFDSDVKTALKKQAIAKVLPAAKKLVRDLKANKISQSATYGNEYTRLGNRIYLNEWDGVSHPVKEGETRKIFYTLDETWGELNFYVKTPRAKPQKRSQAEIDREKRMAEANAEVTRLNELHYELRKGFMESLTVGKNNQLAVLQAAVLVCTGSAICYSGANRPVIVGMLGMEDSYSRDRGKRLVEAFDKVDPGEYPKLIYHRMGDDKTRGFSSTYKGQFPEFQHNEELEIIYTFLGWLGYEMSDDEIALRNGTHELFSRK